MDAPQPDPTPLTFLVFDASGGGGVARSVATMVNELVKTRPVRVVSLYRKRPAQRHPYDPRVELVVLREMAGTRHRRRRGLDRIPSRLRPQPSPRSMSLKTDLLLRRAIREVRSGVVVSTRPSLHLALVAFARPGVVTVGWDHLNFPVRMASPRQAAVLREAVPRLDAFVVLTDADAADYRAELPEAATELRAIRNAVAWELATEPPPLERHVVVAAGRLTPQKGFRRLIRAFAPVAAAHPDWQLHIYGEGKRRAGLRAEVRALGLQRQVKLRGFTDDLPGAMRSASAYALSSHWEGFPMVLLEAMTVGLPVIAFDCPRGPAEIVRHDANGLLVGRNAVAAFSRGLLALVEDAELRRRLGRQALADARAYTPAAIAADWQRLFEDLERPAPVLAPS